MFVALAETVRQFEIPKHEFADLLTAFRQDQRVGRYETFNDLLGYCRYSANPVGHLVLYLCGYRDSERQQLSDYTCTALQLANFWQDVSADFAKGRIYLPLEDLRRFGVSEEAIRDGENTAAFREMMRFEVERAREWFAQGLPLIAKVERALATDIELFSRGGQEILNAIERQHFAVLGRRPVISKTRKLALVARAALGKLLGKTAGYSKMTVAMENAPVQFAPTASQLDMAYSVCRSIARSAAKNFYYGFSGAAAAETQCVERRLCLHAALRRHRRRQHAEPLRSPEQARGLAGSGPPRPGCATHRRSDPAGADRCAARLSDSDWTARSTGFRHGCRPRSRR